ncbi:GNAT family N-acetyltransferase [Riemerella anatipestifer]|uniref:GNAT family N-acetyltransferase n=1 Tax=Riemerella anatipestifer TaxID=34085 RepID=A0AAP3ANH1_RIEAN|nr:GNAT family N-acetyltransferase [Riemerella anatipestifer]AZZ58148.1 N-acetyltransferase [Riemerella anatipestifer]MBT0552464.1 GNAT family N-acetyltransferase [Riemerella anatipestifer]MBT0554802.1 GNAT family N-acetyltransferase [Riemerella anatipestifer]MBT0572581.1 GNAT family N-acetyltransferase [Riemerella anatipestifer]MCE3025385.1 GNAT family N-acetyltransferase [Riemerella anatipestifer]
MMEIQIKPVDSNNITKLQEICQSYINTFPKDERRDEAGFRALARKEFFPIREIIRGEDSVGYIIVWDLSLCLFVEHFEIYTSFRNQNLGSQVLNYLKNKFPLVILESEPDSLGELASRRLNFYQRNGFVILDKSYIQPAYSKDKIPVNMYLLGTNMSDDLCFVTEEIKSKVYNS